MSDGVSLVSVYAVSIFKSPFLLWYFTWGSCLCCELQSIFHGLECVFHGHCMLCWIYITFCFRQNLRDEFSLILLLRCVGWGIEVRTGAVCTVMRTVTLLINDWLSLIQLQEISPYIMKIRALLSRYYCIRGPITSSLAIQEATCLSGFYLRIVFCWYYDTIIDWKA